MLKPLASEAMGMRARDTLTGYEGTIIGHAVHATGCDTICLGGKLDKDGKPEQGQWFDINRLELIAGDKWSPREVSRPQASKPGACVPMPEVR